ncbi:aspartic peptidase domain-containing protein [Cercophora scortea]|uniref:Aspartic peptidase domain-containing protein n=1 Tax=Cercophora scortea TaxID=314031 RepID=A0AAE0MHJ6_9PEZI|nr:aspartic peptidase domain-containing protein [Cercophora scortea]
MLPFLLSLSLLAPAAFIRAPINALPGLPKLKRRQEEIDVANQKAGTSYTIDFEIGTPAQKVTLILDTGSPDLWVNPTCETSGQPEYCASFPVFDYNSSTTIVDLKVADVLSYGKGNVTIEYVTDTVTIGSAVIKKQILGIGFGSHDIPMGILGLSTSVNPDPAASYPYVLDNMATQGLINSRAFSLDLRSVDNPNGAIIFGGVDTGKFIGTLEKLPILDPADTPSGADRYWVTLAGVGLTFPNGSSETGSNSLDIPIFLDSGGTLSRLPTKVFNWIGENIPGAQFDTASGFYIVDCSLASQEGSVDFLFGSKTIQVAWADFIWEIQGVCVVGVLPEDTEPVFGDSFLRAAYVVYDQDNRNLHLAQAANCGSTIVAIKSGKDAVPSSAGECKTTEPPRAASASATASGSPAEITGGGGLPGPAGTGTGTAPVPTGGATGTATGGATAATGTSTSKSGAAPTLGAGLGAMIAFGALGAVNVAAMAM